MSAARSAARSLFHSICNATIVGTRSSTSDALAMSTASGPAPWARGPGEPRDSLSRVAGGDRPSSGWVCCGLMGRIAVTGSVAYDTIMLFRGRFSDHILPEKTHIINLSFQVDTLERRHGGTAANICYTLAMLGQRPLLCAAVGARDFADYGADLEARGVDTSHALAVHDGGTSAAFITTDLSDNQITAFY